MIHYKDKRVGLVTEIPEEAREWRNDPEIFKWCRQNTLIDETSQEAWLEKIACDSSIKMFGVKTINRSMDEAIIGVCGLTSIDRLNMNAEFSLYIAPKHQGHGYGTEALYTLLKHGFEDFNLNRIWGETYMGNPARNMFENLGMIAEGVLRQSYYIRGRFIDSVIVSLLRDDFWHKYGLPTN